MWTGSLGRLSLARQPYPRRTAGRDDNAGQDIATTAWTTVTLLPFALVADSEVRGICNWLNRLTIVTQVTVFRGIFWGQNQFLQISPCRSMPILAKNGGGWPATNEPRTGDVEAACSGQIGMAETRDNGYVYDKLLKREERCYTERGNATVCRLSVRPSNVQVPWSHRVGILRK